MTIDLHIHSKSSDGKMSVEEIFQEARRRNLTLISITDHDSLDSQESAVRLSNSYGIFYLCGIELNVSYSHPEYKKGKPISLDFLGYQYDIRYQPLVEKLEKLRQYREIRAEKILDNLNIEFEKTNKPTFTREDLNNIQATVDGSLGRPHIADYLIRKGIVENKQEAFDRYLVRCNVPKMPLSLDEASALIHGAGGKMVFAHPAHPRGTSLISYTNSIEEQLHIIQEKMLTHIDGIECWHSSYTMETTEIYLEFARRHGLMVTGGSDCHQQPILMGSLDIPDVVAEQFGFSLKESSEGDEAK